MEKENQQEIAVTEKEEQASVITKKGSRTLSAITEKGRGGYTAAALFFAAAMFAGCGLLFFSYGKIPFIVGGVFFCLGAAAAAALGQYIFIRAKGKREVSRYFTAVLLSVNAYLVPEITMNAQFFKSSPIFMLLGLAICLGIFLLGAAVFKKAKVWNIVFSLFFIVYAVMHHYVYLFRGDPIKFSDLSNISSALEIKNEYSFSVGFMPVFCVIDLILMLGVILQTEVKPSSAKARTGSAAAAAACVASLLLSGEWAYNMGINHRYISLNFSGSENLSSYRHVGFDLMFYFDGMYNRLKKPDGYSKEKAEELLSGYDTDEPEKTPTIIAVMNESFADFSHIADFETDKDYLPNFRKLCEEGVSGYVNVSAYGGYSCNSEYEFLTGNSLAFLPTGSAAYTQYMDGKQESIVSVLEGFGYDTCAITPCRPGLWKIDSAYENFGFDETIFKCGEKLLNTENINGYLSDSDVYKVVCKEYEKSTDRPQFIWVTTMQNHGPYDDDYVPDKVSLESPKNDEAQTYLNSIYCADEALGELTDYFKDKDEEVIIVMYGDHYPHIMDFTEALYGKSVSSLSVEEYSKLRQTPFLIWSNKGLETEKIDDISLNYLSNEVFKAAGLPLAPYQQELEKVRKDIPAISGFGYKTSDGKWHSSGETSDFDEIRNEYGIMQYYRMFDYQPE